MSLRAKLLLIFFACAAAPLLALSVFDYLSGVRAVEQVLREDAEKDVSLMARGIETTLAAHEQSLSELASARPLSTYMRDAPPDTTNDLRKSLDTFFIAHRGRFESLTLFNAEGQPVFRANGPLRFQTADFVQSTLHYDSRVRELTGREVLRAPLTQETYGTGMRLIAPVLENERTNASGGALIAELNLDVVLKDAAGETFDAESDARADDASTSSPPALMSSPRPSRRVVMALDNDDEGRILYHTNGALMHQFVSGSMPFFEPVAERMRAGAQGVQFYETPEGDRWFAAFGRVKNLNMSLVVAEDYSAATSGLRRHGLLVFGLALAVCVIGGALLSFITGRAAQRIERVAEGAAAIAGGDLNQHIDLHTGGATNSLVENFNRMSDRLRELIAREAESKQFESFMRLSAMLTHDLKNAITALSMLVSNMERQFHREEFRADAILSLREATEKLNRIVARLSEPVKSLSGEYRRAARPADLVPVIRRVLAANAEPYAALYRIEEHLPETLVATVEVSRIEAVIENLVINALEAMGAGGGKLTVEAGREGDRFVFFSVSDTGVGMSEEFIRDRLFHPFATTKSKGIGLGLFTCREIVETHGGRISAESKLGAGTRFRVVLPSGLTASGTHRRSVAGRGD